MSVSPFREWVWRVGILLLGATALLWTLYYLGKEAYITGYIACGAQEHRVRKCEPLMVKHPDGRDLWVILDCE